MKHGFGQWRDILLDGELGLQGVLREELGYTPAAMIAQLSADKVLIAAVSLRCGRETAMSASFISIHLHMCYMLSTVVALWLHCHAWGCICMASLRRTWCRSRRI